jgi:hypothetical protein
LFSGDSSISIIAEGHDGPKPYILNIYANYIYQYINNSEFFSLHFVFLFKSRAFHTRIKAGSSFLNLLGKPISLIRIVPSKYFSSLNNLNAPLLDPQYVTGFSDGEASFRLNIYKRKDCRTGWWVIPYFTLEVHEKDGSLLYDIKAFFGVGSISIRKSNGQIIYTVGSVKDLMEVIIPHFTKYPLITKKSSDFLLFKSAVELINQKKHLTIEGLKEIVSVRGAMNLGLTDALIESFPGISPKERPVTQFNFSNPGTPTPEVRGWSVHGWRLSPYWFAGFTEAEGCFFVSVHKSNSYKNGYQTQLSFILVQNLRDVNLFESFISYLGCGKIKKGSNNSISFLVTKSKDLEDKIIPFFQKYNLLYSKNNEFLDFCKVFSLVKSKSHLTEKGLNQIVDIKYGMNRGRNNTILREYSNFSNLEPRNLKDKFFIQKRQFHDRVKANKRIGPHNLNSLSIIFGSLLGNAKISKLVEGSRLIIYTSNKNYAQWLYSFFFTNGYCSNLEPRMYTRKLKHKGTEVVHYGYEFNTFTFRSFNWIHEMFYSKGKKVIKPRIENYMTPLCLAIWISDDGCWAKPGVRIAVNCFTLAEVELLVKILKDKFNLDCTIQLLKASNNYSIYIKSSSIFTLRELLLPYIHPSMKYKLGL